MAQESTNDEWVSYLMAFSDEVLVMIFQFLSTKDKISLSKVCRRFDRILLDRRLCRDVEISLECQENCLDHIGFYFRKRRQLIHSLSINSCHWIPTSKVLLMTKNLSNLSSLNIININMSVVNLSKILKESNQLRELSWSWQDDDRSKSRDICWSELPADERMTLTGLERLYVRLRHPWCLAARELYGFCHSLTHLTVEVDPSFSQLPLPKTSAGEHLSGSKKLNSLIAWQNSYTKDPEANHSIEESLGRMLKHFWLNCGGFQRAWECLWTNAYSQIPWRNEMTPPRVNIISTNLKSIVIDSTDFATLCSELPVSQLVIHMSSWENEGNFPPLIAIAPKLKKLAILTNIFSMGLNSWVNAAIGSSEYLVEINLCGVHYCEDKFSLAKLWLALRCLNTLKKLAVAPCILPKFGRATNSQQLDVGDHVILPHSGMAQVSKKLSEMLSLNSLELFEVGNPSHISSLPSSNDVLCHLGAWVPYIAAVSVWPTLTCLTIDSIANLRSLYQFNLVTLNCKNLTSLTFRNLGTKGYCAYVKDIVFALSNCQALKHFRLDQPYIFDHIKGLLASLSKCINLETIVVTNYNVMHNSRLQKKEDFSPILLQVANRCMHLNFMLITLPDVTRAICNKLKNKILNRISRPTKSALVMEFCSYPKMSRTVADNYHEFLKFPRSSCHHDELHMFSKVALSPPLKHTC